MWSADAGAQLVRERVELAPEVGGTRHMLLALSALGLTLPSCGKVRRPCGVD